VITAKRIKMVKQREGFKFVVLEPAKTWMAEGKCAGCGKPKAEWKRRQDWACCSAECTKEFRKKSTYFGWPDLREKAFKRDKFTCRHCGFVAKDVMLTTGFSYKKDKSTFLVGDHIKPIALGGEEWDIDNVQTLCIPCNKVKTKNDAADIARLRKEERLAKAGQVKLQ